MFGWDMKDRTMEHEKTGESETWNEAARFSETMVKLQGYTAQQPRRKKSRRPKYKHTLP
jgi:hypothetical protein